MERKPVPTDPPAATPAGGVLSASTDGRPVVLHGIGVGHGAVIAPVVRAHSAPSVMPTTLVPDVPQARDDVLRALETVADRLEERAGRAHGRAGELLLASVALARHPALRSEVEARVLAGQGPAAAVESAVTALAETLVGSGSGSGSGSRVGDGAALLRSVRDRVVAELAGMPEPGVPTISRPSVLVADDLTPADTALLDVANVVGIVLAQGGPTGHTAIVARQLGRPCVVQVGDLSELVDGVEVAVDASSGAVVVAPDDGFRRRVVNRAAVIATLEEDRGSAATADGHHVDLLVNVASGDDARRGAAHGAAGVGLFRTESLFQGRNGPPSPTEQEAAYTDVLLAMGGRTVIIRTLDAGSDKPLEYLGIGAEDNPALGVRGFRLARRSGDLLREQLSAIARAGQATGVQPWVMAPMVSTAQEARQFAAMARTAGLRRVGVTVEVPSAAIRIIDLLAEVDFVSIGTNDLAQYTMATDRLRGEIGDLLDPWQPAVLELVGRIAESGQMAGKPVSVCGESAADPLMALVLTGMGVTSLSMSPSALGPVRYAIRHHTLEQCREIASWAIQARSAVEARRGALALVSEEVRELLALGETPSA